MSKEEKKFGVPYKIINGKKIYAKKKYKRGIKKAGEFWTWSYEEDEKDTLKEDE